MNSTLFLSIALTSTLLFQSGLAQAKSRGFSDPVFEEIRNAEDISLHLEGNASFFHHDGGEVTVKYKINGTQGTKCGDLSIEGHGRIYKEFKEDMKKAAKREGYGAFAQFFEGDLEKLKATICYDDKNILNQDLYNGPEYNDRD